MVTNVVVIVLLELNKVKLNLVNLVDVNKELNVTVMILLEISEEVIYYEDDYEVRDL